MTYEVTAKITMMADSEREALSIAAMCVTCKDSFEAGRLSGVGLAKGWVEVKEVGDGR